MNVRDLYPDLDSYTWNWHEPLRGQKVRRYQHPNGDLIDVYNESGCTFAITHNHLKDKNK